MKFRMDHVHSRARHAKAAQLRDPANPSAPFALFCMLTVSILLHFGARFPMLGALRIDAVLGAATLAAILIASGAAISVFERTTLEKGTLKWLLILIAYVFVTMPFVEWPGSVLRVGLEPFLKAVIFCFFVVATVTTVKRLRIFLLLFVACQSIRIFEPLYLHLTTGYWGGAAYIGEGEFMDRLSGAPSDVVNPNGLAYLIVSTIPIVYFLGRGRGVLIAVVSWALIGAMVYTLLLTGSRSGFLLLVLLVILWALSGRARLSKMVLVAVCGVFAFGNLSDLQKDRFVSIVDRSAIGGASATGRIEGVFDSMKTTLRRPLFGHGLGTSAEVNANFTGHGQISHNLFAEVAQELGYVGLSIFLMFVWFALRTAWQANLVGRNLSGLDPVLGAAVLSLPVLMLVDVVFSLASYGLSEPHWYLLAGLAVVVSQLIRQESGQRLANESDPEMGVNSGQHGRPRWRRTVSRHR